MGHEDGEIAWARAAGNEGTVFMVPNLNSKGFDNIVAAARSNKPDQTMWFQMYVNPDRGIVLDQLKVRASGGSRVCRRGWVGGGVGRGGGRRCLMRCCVVEVVEGVGGRGGVPVVNK